MKINISSEDICNLKDCYKKTTPIAEPYIDLWPLTLNSIIKRYEESVKNNSDQPGPTLPIPEPCPTCDRPADKISYDYTKKTAEYECIECGIIFT
jgi:hypothetical protein